jgi:hypothetical protein
MQNPVQKPTKKGRSAGGVTGIVEWLLSKHKALSAISTAKKRERERDRDFGNFLQQ